MTTPSCQAVIDQDPLLYIDVTEALRRNIGRVLYVDDDACLIGFPHGNEPISEFTTVCGDPKSARRMLDHLPWERSILFAVHEEHTLLALGQNHLVKPFLGEAFRQVAYLKRDPAPIPKSPVEVRPLDVSHLERVAAIHKDEEADYLRDRLESGVMLGAFDGDTLVGFIGVHSEGSMGLLQVYPSYRRRGIGALLESHMINRLLAQGHTPYGSVLTDNTASLALQRSLGMALSVPTFRWLYHDHLS